MKILTPYLKKKENALGFMSGKVTGKSNFADNTTQFDDDHEANTENIENSSYCNK